MPMVPETTLEPEFLEAMTSIVKVERQDGTRDKWGNETFAPSEDWQCYIAQVNVREGKAGEDGVTLYRSRSAVQLIGVPLTPLPKPGDRFILPSGWFTHVLHEVDDIQPGVDEHGLPYYLSVTLLSKD